MYHDNAVVLNLASNEFRWSTPSDDCSKSCNVNIPHAWLTSKDAYLDYAQPQIELVEKFLWSLFERDGPFHPFDRYKQFGPHEDAAK